ncbi:nucleoside 2-deoxyribosyltransferase [Streptomyces malaysiensis]|uniref:Nucleoside 2-deoxyribosyltransferase n=1 Tax=Streptomyces malaysiensis subsp. samsunensis TaxID=459658 RepID=A0A9X2M7V3_STRMQ|nr:nucleoside 2-deoxyribosyltransferase [Streptomyces samsunensis]MCQ8836410.1 nucleoside 2-deoxyribosyltransferase [Streptomyces samsunensis]
MDVFVGGPIQHAILPDGFVGQLRDAISTAIWHVEENGGNVFSAHVAEKFGVETASFTPDQVSVRDFRWMTKCDVFVPVLPVLPDGTLLRTDGTHVELGWASALGRPVVMITKQPFVESASHLLKGLHQVGDIQVIDFDEFSKDPQCLINRILAATERARQVLKIGIS